MGTLLLHSRHCHIFSKMNVETSRSVGDWVLMHLFQHGWQYLSNFRVGFPKIKTNVLGNSNRKNTSQQKIKNGVPQKRKKEKSAKIRC